MSISGFFRRLALSAFALALVPLASNTAFAMSLWVSSSGGNACTHSTLQAAIDAAQSNTGDDVIFLVGSGPFPGPFSMLGGGGITIVGGVPSCGATTSTQYATLQAPSGKRPLTILLGQDGRITLRRLVLTTSFGTLKGGDGGGLWFAGPGPLSEVVLDDCRVINNGTLSDGGGIFVSRGFLRLTGGSLVSGNTAVNGGGIAGVNNAVVAVDGSNVAGNTAYFDGGGIYTPSASVRLGGLGLPVAVANNIAGDDGGGLYLGSSTGTSELGGVALTSINGNQARRGGGIFLDDSWTILDQVDISLNTASQTGGGIAAMSGTLLMIDPGEPLVDGFPIFTQNKAGDGAALHASGALTEVSLGTGTFYGHETKTAGSALVAASDGASVSFRGITVFSNLIPELFAVEGGASLALFHASIANNTVTRLVRWDGSGPGIRITNSAFSETEPFFSGLPTPQSLPQFTCVVSRSPLLLQGMPPGTDLSQVVVADPQFVAPERGDLHLWPGSLAVDLCAYAAGFGANGGYDRDHDFRGFDEPLHPNASGQTHDAGADEVVPIVWDDFESGSFSHWPLVVPPVPGSGNNLQITTAARLGPLTSQRGLQLTLVDPASQAPTDAFLWAGPSPVPGSDPTRITSTFFLDPQSLTMSSTAGLNRLRLLTFYDRNGAGAPRLAFALVRTSHDKWSLEVSYWPDPINGPVVAGSAFFACATLPCGNSADWRNNQIELRWRGGSPAHLTVWRTRFFNGVPDPASRVLMFSLDLPMPGARIDEVALGKIGPQSAGTFGQIFFDEVSFTR